MSPTTQLAIMAIWLMSGVIEALSRTRRGHSPHLLRGPSNGSPAAAHNRVALTRLQLAGDPDEHPRHPTRAPTERPGDSGQRHAEPAGDPLFRTVPRARLATSPTPAQRTKPAPPPKPDLGGPRAGRRLGKP